MDYPKFIVSNQKEESISIQRVKVYSFDKLLYPVSSELMLTLCILGNFHDFFLLLLIFSKSTFSKNSFRNTIRLSYSSDPDQTLLFVGPDLGPKVCKA